MALGGRRWYAATASGLLISSDQGGSWSGAAVDGASLDEARDFYSVSVRGRTVAAATLHQVWYSSDEGEHWWLQPLPPWVTRIYEVSVVGDDELWLATREGALRWRRTAPGVGEWQHVLNGLPAREVVSIRAEDGWLLAGAAASDTVYVSRDQGAELGGRAGDRLRGDRRGAAGGPALCADPAARGAGAGAGSGSGGRRVPPGNRPAFSARSSFSLSYVFEAFLGRCAFRFFFSYFRNGAQFCK